MADVMTAGSFVAAVLEEAGYLAQSNFLRDFRDFFREAGAFVYILGGIGGVVSVVLFGSFRAARYLLIGPALYWFLVGPTTKFDGVVWQVGGGEPRGLHNVKGEEQSRTDVNRALRQAGLAGETQGEIDVAVGFALFVKPINMVTRGFVDLILGDDEDYEYLINFGKGRAVETMIATQVDNPVYIEMLEGDFVRQCADMVGYALARSAFEFRDDVTSRMGPGRTTTEARKKFYEDEFKKYRDKGRVNPGPSTRAYYRAAGVDPNSRESIDCKEMWQVVASYLQDQAKPAADNILRMAQGDYGDRALACERVMEKIQPNGGGGGNCEQNLQNAIALFMLRNAFADRRALGRFVKRAADSIGEPKAIREGSNVQLTGTFDDKYLKQAREFVMNMTNGDLGMQVGRLSATDEMLYVVGTGELIADNIADEQERKKFREDVQSVAKISAIGGPMDAGFTEYPRYHLRNLRQQLFTWSLQLPYWQGVLLYLLACAYPFMALIVLLPGRAVSFLNLPLAWLWVKSWDIGLAFVMIFERVLWNILPSLRITSEMVGGNLADKDLWAALSETQKFDHTWNLHVYYICLSMATFAIPVVTGVATLKSRRAALASFTDKLGASARDAGARAAGAFGMSVMADRVQTIKSIQGMAYRVVSEKGEGLTARGRGSSANAWGIMSALSVGLSQAPGAIGKGGAAKAIGIAGNAVGDYLTTSNNMLMAEARFDREWLASFHEIFGRYGKLAMMNEAYAAAMDGSGGFELNEHKVSPIDAYADLLGTKMENTYKIGARLMGVNPVLGGALLMAATEPESVPVHLRKLTDDYDTSAVARGIKVGMDATEGMFLSDGTVNFVGPDGTTTRTQHRADPRGIQSVDLFDRVFSTSPESIAEVRRAVAHPDEFRKEYTYTKEDALRDAPRAIQQAFENPTTNFGVSWEGREVELKKNGLLRDSTEPENFYTADPLGEWQRANPGVGRMPLPDTGPAAPAGNLPPAESPLAPAREIGTTDQQFAFSVRQAIQAPLNSTIQFLTDEPATPGRGKITARDKYGWGSAEDESESQREHKLRMANLQMDWLFEDDETIKENQHEAARLRNEPIRTIKPTKGIA